MVYLSLANKQTSHISPGISKVHYMIKTLVSSTIAIDTVDRVHTTQYTKYIYRYDINKMWMFDVYKYVYYQQNIVSAWHWLIFLSMYMWTLVN